MAKKINELKSGDIFFIHPIYSKKKLKLRCTFIEMVDVGHYVRINYAINGITDWVCIDKKFKDKPVSISITTDDSEETYTEMRNTRMANLFYVRNVYLRTEYSLKSL